MFIFLYTLTLKIEKYVTRFDGNNSEVKHTVKVKSFHNVTDNRRQELSHNQKTVWCQQVSKNTSPENMSDAEPWDDVRDVETIIR